jgi:hypothetical protein
MSEGGEAFREDLAPDREDDPRFDYPKAPSQMRGLPDDELCAFIARCPTLTSSRGTAE